MAKRELPKHVYRQRNGIYFQRRGWPSQKFESDFGTPEFWREYAGILSLGHGVFFALGGYAMGMYLMRQIGDRGVYGNPELPDFMVFLNWQELPWFWHGFNYFGFAMLMVLFVPL